MNKRDFRLFTAALLFALLAPALPLYALELTVDEAVDYALKNGKNLKAAAIELEIKKRESDTSWNALLPSVQASASLVRSNEVHNSFKNVADMLNPLYTFHGIPPVTVPEPLEKDYWKAVGNIGITLNFNAALVNEIRASRADYEAGFILWEQALRETERNIRKMFYGLLLQSEDLKLQETTLINAENRLKQAEIRYKNGLAPELALLQAQAAYENQKPEVLKAKHALKRQFDLFIFLLGLPSDTVIELKGTIEPVFVDIDAERLIADCSNRRFDLASLNKNLELMRLRLLSMNLQSYTPSLSLNYTWQPVVTDIGKDWFKDKNVIDNGSFSASLVWNITDTLPFSQNRIRTRSLNDNIRKAEIQYEAVVQKAENEIRSLADSLNQRRLLIEAGKGNIELAQKTYDMTLEAYRTGTVRLSDVRDAETRLNQAELGLAAEKYNYLCDLLDLEYALNTNLCNF
ncbi:TolC family protein [Treponema sp. HNW]|uniref:TolC family protein n=1 Tax=Treponema sp. HNW TaxID=3116654 RepID=UPI003D0E5E18